MANLNNVTDKLKNEDGSDIMNLKMYDEISENARLEWDPLPFESYGKIKRETNKTLCIKVREYFAKTFHDIRGVNLVYAPGMRQQFIFELYFGKNGAPLPEGKIENLTDLTIGDSKTKTSLFFQKQLVDNKAAGKHFTLNQKTKVLLSEFMYGGRDANKPGSGKWNQFISEEWINSSDWTYNPRAGETIVKVAGCFDYHKIIKKVFGDTMVIKTVVEETPEGYKAKNFNSSAEYELRYIKPSMMDPKVFYINIEQFDRAAVEEMTVEENPIRVNVVSGISYY